MTTLRRILKFTPAVMLGLMVVAWVASHFRRIWLNVDCDQRGVALDFAQGGLDVIVHPSAGFEMEVQHYPLAPQHGNVLGTLGYSRLEFLTITSVPVLLIVTILFPLAIGPFISFRFRLWHYLAYTALVAVELAYYLRLQE
jgi:hypothetical protein